MRHLTNLDQEEVNDNLAVLERLPPAWDDINRGSDDPAQRLVAIDRCLAAASSHRRKVQSFIKQKETELEYVTQKPGEPYDQRKENDARKVQSDLNVLLAVESIGNMTPIFDTRLTALLGQPSLAFTVGIIKSLQVKRAEAEAELARNADPTALRPYRLKKGANFFISDVLGVVRKCVAGDTVQLTAAQAHNWRDRVELIAEQPVAELKTTKKGEK